MRALKKRGVVLKKRALAAAQAGATRTIDLLAALAQDTRASGSAVVASPRGTGYLLPVESRKLGSGEIIIAVADASTITLRTVKGALPSGGMAKRGSLEPQAGIAVRLAELEVALGELGLSGDTAALSQEEELLLAKGGVKREALKGQDFDPVVRTAAEFAKLRRDSFSTQEAAKVLGVNPSRIRQRVAGEPRTLYGIKLGREWRVPRFQFDEKGLVPCIEEVVTHLPRDLSPVAVYRWFTTPNPDLCEVEHDERRFTPIAWLRMGNSAKDVVALAAAL